MSLYFDKVQFLTYRHTPILLNAGLRYRLEKRFTIEGILLDRANGSGVQSITNKEQAIINAANDYDDIYLEGILFGQGRIENISFGGGTMVNQDKYSYEIVCYEDGNLFNATNGVYAGITWANAKRIESISEDFQYSENEQGDKNYTHSIDVRFAQGTVTQEINLAKALAAEFFSATSGLGAFLFNETDTVGLKKLYVENYNIVDGTCSFNETVEIPSTRNGVYSLKVSYDVEQDADGYTNVTETCEIQGLTNPKFGAAQTGYQAQVGGTYTRCLAVYNAYNFSDATLFPQHLKRGVSHNKFEGIITITTTFSNNPRYHNNAVWEYTLDLSKDREGFYTVSEQGSVLGFGRPLIDKYNNALVFFETTVKGVANVNVYARLNDFYTNGSGRSLPLILIGQSFAKNEYEGTIQYSFTQTDNDLYDDDDIKKVELEVSTSNPVHLVQNYNVFNYKELIQTQKQCTLGQKSINITLKGKRGIPLLTYITKAKQLCNANLPSATDYFIADCNYSLTPINNDFSFTLNWSFKGDYKELGNLTVN